MFLFRASEPLQPSASTCADYREDIPPKELAIGLEVGRGTEKVVFAAEWAGRAVVAVNIFGRSKARDLAMMKRIAALGHPSIVPMYGMTADGEYEVHARAALGSLTNCDGSPDVLTRRALVGRASAAVLLERVRPARPTPLCSAAAFSTATWPRATCSRSRGIRPVRAGST